jgi:hypothetical protein
MNPIKLFFSVLVIAVLSSSNLVNGQTVQVYTTVTADGMAWCLNREIVGSWTYHLTYHLDKKTGYVDRMNVNVHHAEVFDKETGERYIFIDIANDNLGLGWEWWNDPDNPGFDYDLPENSIPIGPDLPESGANIWATFRLIGKGGQMFYMRQVTRITVNANGVTTAYVDKWWEDCNPAPPEE